MREYEIGQLLVNDILPEDMRDYNRVWSKGTVGKVLTELAKKHPDQYKEVSHRLLKLGAEAAYLTNGDSFSLDDMGPTSISKQMQKELNKEVQQILARAHRAGVKTNDPKVNKAIIDACLRWAKKSEEGTNEESDFDTNALFRQAQKTGVGAQKPGTYKSIRTGDVLYVDQNNKPVPIPVTHSYAQGLRPAEYFAGAFGTRKGIVDLQKATQDAGYLCCAETELVMMADFTSKAIKDIKEGDYVLGIDENRVAKPVKVTHVFDNGIRECYKTTFRIGTDKNSTISFTSTKEHRVLCETVKQYKEKVDGKLVHKYSYVQDVLPVGTKGSFRALPINGTYNFDGIHDDYAFLVGILLGDGSMTNTKNNRDIMLACFDDELVDYLQGGYLDSLDLKINVKNIKRGQYTIRDKVRHTENIVVDKNKFTSALNSNLKIKLQELGLLGTYSHTKFIPDIVYKWDKESIAKLIAGYFVTDGSIYTQNDCTQIKFASVSKRLIEQLKELLETRFGILCNSIVESNSNKNRHESNKTAYYLGIYRREDVLAFCKEIPVVGVKAKRVKDFIVNYSNCSKNTRKFYRISQEYVGPLHTYDLEVDSPNHLFVLASGLIVHNSKQLVQIAHRLVVDSNDSTDPIDPDNPIGYPSTVDDQDNEGAMLAMPVAGYKRNTILTPKILADMKQKGVKNILVRSVIAGGPANGGIYAYDAGVRETGDLPVTGDFVGIKAVQAISEPITQSAISCLHPYTKVRMGDGTVKAIKDIKVGDTVLGADKQGYTAPVKVVNVFNNGIQPVYLTVYRKSVKTKSVIAIAATKEHKALQITRKSNCKGEKYNNIIRELPIGEPGKNVSVVLARGPKNKLQGVNEPGALLLGLLLGDGCYTESINRPCFSCADPTLIEELTDYMKSVNCRFSFHKGSQCYYRVAGLNNDGSGDNTRNPAKQLLLKYNMFGKYSFEKEIPEDVKNWDSDSVSALLSGLIITDGSIYKSNQAKHYHMNYASTSYKLVKQVKDLLYLHCGASCAKIHINKSSRKKYLYSIVYSKPAELLRVLNFIKLYGVKEPLRKTAIEECKALLTIQDYYACKRIKQVFLGNIKTLDIEVDNEDHLFVLANGMVVSNSKHSGGVAGAESGKAISGFKYINQLIQVPKHFPGGATHSTVDGKVEKIRPAAQGGYYITVAGKDHYVRTDKGDDTPILVKVGDEVEAGDVMSDGIPNPATIVKYKGLGEGRRYFVNMFRDALDRAGSSVNRRNIEVLSRGLLSYVKLNDEVGDYSPDDILPYTMIAADYQPRDGYICREPKACKNMYLEKPVLHYTIGTRITPKVIKELNDYNIKHITCHKDPPPFESEMVRGMAHAATDPDWGTKMLGSYNKESLLESTRLGAISNTQGTSYVPALAFGDTTFGNSGALSQKQSSLSILQTVAKAYGIK